MINHPDIAIVHTTTFPPETFDQFVDIVSKSHLRVLTEEREDDGIYAGVEWLIPTAVIVYLAKSYFDGFLKEMGKDHYTFLKSGLSTLWEKLLAPNAAKVVLAASPGKKIDQARTYSHTYSIIAEADAGYSFKLLIQQEVSLQQYERIIDALLVFLARYHERLMDDQIIEHLAATRGASKTILLAFNFETESIIFINPIPERLRNIT